MLETVWLAGLVGWVWGSFLDQVISRMPRSGLPRLTHQGQPVGWFHPRRSICLACGSPIPWYNNIPIMSYLVQRGRCRHCGAAIGLRTLVVELLTPLCFAGLVPWVAGQTMAGHVAAGVALSWLLLVPWVVLEKRVPGKWFWGTGLVMPVLIWWFW